MHAVHDGAAPGTIVDRLDLGTPESEIAHGFEEDSTVPGSWHTKLLRYPAPLDGFQLEDNGRRLPGWAQWTVRNVSSASDLFLVARHDHTAAASYAVEVNGGPVDTPLVAPGRPDEWWGESWVRIPKQLLVDGDNTIRISRRPESEREAEWYYMWFLQELSPQRTAESTEGLN
jgi:hypothetical protein